MPQTPRPAPTGALSPFALSILRPLLRRIALWHRDKIGEIKSTVDPETNGDDPPDAGRPCPDALALPVHMRLDQHYGATPAARRMRTDDITRAIAERRDPWAEDAETGQTNRLPQPPIEAMVAAACFAALFDSPQDIAAVTSDRALTLVLAPRPEDRQMMWSQMVSILEWLGDLDAPGGAVGVISRRAGFLHPP